VDRRIWKVSFGSSEEIANAPGMSVVPFASRHSVYFTNVPILLKQSAAADIFVRIQDVGRDMALLYKQ
jgi:hypothetical protein